MKNALLVLADGTVFKGMPLGYSGETSGEVVFNTAMTGYQEILTDPSYKGQMVAMTCSQIGNYGVTQEDSESRRLWIEGFIVREPSAKPSNWRNSGTLSDYLATHQVVGIAGIDTRALTRHLRDHGSQQGIISHANSDLASLREKARNLPSIVGRDLVAEVTCATPYRWEEGTGDWPTEPPNMPDSTDHQRFKSCKVVVLDFGVKWNILRRLVDVGCEVHVVPASTTADEIKAFDPEGILLSNGPGDPEAVPYAVKTVRELIGWRPIFGICLGHQILGLALGMNAHKLQFGHHGGNHPVIDLRSRKVEITSQNHNFSVGPSQIDHAHADGLPEFHTQWGRVQVTHRSLNDGCCEGMLGLDMPFMSTQYHPEASPGPHDSAYIFRQFMKNLPQHSTSS